MAHDEMQIGWGPRRRLAFLEFRLFWDGHVNRSDLVDHFEISVPQASADLSRYQAAAPDNIRYDKTAKAYVACATFTPRFMDASADRYLAQLRALAAGILPKEETWLGDLPPYAATPLVRRRLSADTLRSLLDAIRNRLSLRVQYQSFSNPEPTWRWIAPHALAFDGFRWHARAWCPTNKAFRDFVLPRILNIDAFEPQAIEPQADIEWHTEVTLRLAPHPLMSEGMRRAIEFDYGMSGGYLEVVTRICLSYYVERVFNLDLPAELLAPGRQQLVLVNRDSVNAARAEAASAARKLTESSNPQTPHQSEEPPAPL